MVYVDADAIDTLAGKFGGWATDISDAAKPLQNLTVKPGNFTDATNLANAVTQRAKDLYTNLTNLQNAFNTMQTSLNAAAKDYHASEDDATVLAKFDTMNTNVNGDLPGLNAKNG